MSLSRECPIAVISLLGVMQRPLTCASGFTFENLLGCGPVNVQEGLRLCPCGLRWSQHPRSGAFDDSNMLMDKLMARLVKEIRPQLIAQPAACSSGFFFGDLLGPSPVDVNAGNALCICGMQKSLHNRGGCEMDFNLICDRFARRIAAEVHGDNLDSVFMHDSFVKNSIGYYRNTVVWWTRNPAIGGFALMSFSLGILAFCWRWFF
uniref:Uncharacterized protein n=1 Tax=Spongospora subterranea TaxID=70186 RepID=A0A0H5QV72_9EUKA|eukprot:CRZ05888.1 hypothetical protein [Spongospora subterranea]